MKLFLVAVFVLLQAFVIAGCGARNYPRGGLGMDGGLDGVGGECGTMNQTACETFILINQERAKNGLPSLKPYDRCIGMAQEQSDDMDQRGYFAHDRPAFPDRPAESFSARMGRWGLGGGGGENIARTGSPAGAVSGWMNSPGHRANILNTNWVGSGIGYTDGLYTQCFSVSGPQ